MDEAAVERIKAISYALYGSQTRLQVAAHLADRIGRLVYVSAIANELNVPNTYVERDFKRFVEGEILRHEGRRSRNQPDFHEVLPSEYWGGAVRFLQALRAAPVPPAASTDSREAAPQRAGS